MNKLILFSFVGLSMSVNAYADTEFYAGASIGTSYYADYTGSLASIVSTAVARANPGVAITALATQKTTDVGAKVFGGGWFNDNFGAEVGYAYLGQTTGTVTTSGVATIWSVTQKNYAGYLDAMIGTKLDNKSRVYLKVGAYSASTNASAAVTGPGGSASAIGNSNNTGLHYGVGFDYPVSEKMNFRVEAEGFNKVGNSSTTGQGSIGLFSVGLAFKF